MSSPRIETPLVSEQQPRYGNDNVMPLLQEVLRAKLTSINQSFVHAKVCEKWGYRGLANRARQHSMIEMRHAEACIERILFLDGYPEMAELFAIRPGASVQAQLENDLDLELEAIPRLKRAIKATTLVDDASSCEVFEKILADEERRVDWLEAQLFMIQQMGYDNYVSQLVHSEA